MHRGFHPPTIESQCTEVSDWNSSHLIWTTCLGEYLYHCVCEMLMCFLAQPPLQLGAGCFRQRSDGQRPPESGRLSHSQPGGRVLPLQQRLQLHQQVGRRPVHVRAGRARQAVCRLIITFEYVCVHCSLFGGSREKTRPELSADEKVKRAFYVTQRYSDQVDQHEHSHKPSISRSVTESRVVFGADSPTRTLKMYS